MSVSSLSGPTLSPFTQQRTSGGALAHSAKPSGDTLGCQPGDHLQPVRAADHLEHDLVTPGTDPVQAQVAPGALDPIFLHVAVAAVDLDALVGDLDGDPGRVKLGHGDLAHGVLAVLEAPRR